MNIRKISTTDFSNIYKIYSYYIDHSTATFEYEKPVETEFSKKLKNELDCLPGFIAYTENNICLGYAYASRYSYEKAYDRTVKLTIYMNPHHHQKKVSSQLYTYLEQALKAQGIIQMLASITASNIASLKFHEKRNFVEIARLEKLGFKMGGWHDEVLMRKQINPYKNF